MRMGCLCVALAAVTAPAEGQRHVLWDASQRVPKSSEVLPLKGVRFHVIKKREPKKDGYNWLHGVAVVWHGGKLYVSFGHNKGSENTASEEARGRVSTDGGKTFSDVFTIDVGEEKDLAVSHGVFLSYKGVLWAFHGSFHGRMKDLHTRAYVLDEATGKWRPRGVVARDGFWPTAEPRKMPDGNWIMAGFCVAGANPAAVAISRGDDFTKWNVVKIPRAKQIGKMWGESAVLIDGKSILNIARYGRKAVALVSVSEDCGRTWPPMTESNLPMAGSKPYVGVLSTGQRYLICTTTSDSGHRRSPLTIALGRPGEKVFRRIFRISRRRAAPCFFE